jgi:hydroxymethylbilane synthase
MIGVGDPSATRVGVALQVRMVQSSITSTALRIGTRGSPLALAQAREVRDRLAAVHGLDATAIEVRAIRTSGDRIQNRTLAEAGGKGLFTKEIEEALREGAIDLAVHSAKDLSTILPDGLALAAFLPREDARDAFVSRTAGTLGELAPRSVVGTASVRRQALVRRLRPDLAVVPLRGNVDTRLRKLDEGIVDATLLALAGLKRLGRADAATAVMSLEDFPPAIGQGAIAIEARSDDTRLLALLAAIGHEDTAIALAVERAFLAVLDGSCRTPIAGHAIVSDGAVAFRGMILRPDGSEIHETRRRGSRAEAAGLGADAGRELKARVPADFFAHG